MRYWKFSQKTKLKQNVLTNSEKEVGNFLKTGTTVVVAPAAVAVATVVVVAAVVVLNCGF